MIFYREKTLIGQLVSTLPTTRTRSRILTGPFLQEPSGEQVLPMPLHNVCRTDSHCSHSISGSSPVSMKTETLCTKVEPITKNSWVKVPFPISQEVFQLLHDIEIGMHLSISMGSLATIYTTTRPTPSSQVVPLEAET